MSRVCICPRSTGLTGWVNPEPLGPAELSAHVALAELLVAVGLVVCLVTDDIARANFSVCGLRVGYDR